MDLRIITPEGVVFSKEATMVVVPTEVGPTGILPHHTPLLSKLKIGELKVKRDGEEDYYAVTKGIIEVCENKVTILVQEAIHAKEIDVEDIRRKKEERELYRDKVDFAHFEADLEVLLNKLRIAEQRG
jgi:F-type H+-transporting ATPase subunit epsilon